jgi:hypothetical protein
LKSAVAWFRFDSLPEPIGYRDGSITAPIRHLTR